MPRVEGALRHPILFLRVMRALSSLRVMKSRRDPARRVRLTIKLAALGLAEMHRAGHPAMRAFAEKSPERVYQWSVTETGDSAWLRIGHGRAQAGAGTYPRRRPFVRFVFPTVDGAFRVFANEASQMEAVERGWVETYGSPEYTRKVSFLLQTMDELLS